MLCVYYNKSQTKNPTHPENHDRISIAIDYIKEKLPYTTIYNNNTIYDYLKDTLKLGSRVEIANIILTQIYSEEYLESINSKCNDLEDDDIIYGDTYFTNITYNEIMDNSIILYNVCYQITQNNIKYAYCLIRPPSHHSSLNKYNGFCVVNHTYLTAKYLHDKYNKKVLILDYDVHHGDGTQALIKQHLEDDIYFVSIHCYGNGFYPGTGDVDENNEKVLNIPMKRGSNNSRYLEEFEKIKEYIEKSKVDIIIVSNGLDAHKDDPFSVMKLTNQFYRNVTDYLKSLDKQLIYILEGGYNPKTIGSISVDIIKKLSNIDLDELPESELEIDESNEEFINYTKLINIEKMKQEELDKLIQIEKTKQLLERTKYEQEKTKQLEYQRLIEIEKTKQEQERTKQLEYQRLIEIEKTKLDKITKNK